MSTLDKIQFLLKKQDRKQKELTDYLGISKNAFTDWKSGRIKSWQKYLPEIANYFGVSVDYLLSNDSHEEGTLSKQEQFLIEGFRSLNNTGKDYILQTLEIAKAAYKKSDTISDMEKAIG